MKLKHVAFANGGMSREVRLPRRRAPGAAKQFRQLRGTRRPGSRLAVPKESQIVHPDSVVAGRTIRGKVNRPKFGDHFELKTPENRVAFLWRSFALLASDR
jgi:hypothetical protein